MKLAIGRIYLADNIVVLWKLPSESVVLVYSAPPFNTGRTRILRRLKTVRSPNGARVDFQGCHYSTAALDEKRFSDRFDDYLGFLKPRPREGAHRVLARHGSSCFNVDSRQVHYCKVLLDSIFGHHCFLNEIIWTYDYGGRPRNRWPAKHDNILLYAKDPPNHVFNAEAVDRIRYMAPGLVGHAKAERVKMPTATWWQTIVPTNSAEKTGYPTQKPLAILRSIVNASSLSGQLVLNFLPAAEPREPLRSNLAAGAYLWTTIRKRLQSWPTGFAAHAESNGSDSMRGDMELGGGGGRTAASKKVAGARRIRTMRPALREAAETK